MRYYRTWDMSPAWHSPDAQSTEQGPSDSAQANDVVQVFHDANLPFRDFRRICRQHGAWGPPCCPERIRSACFPIQFEVGTGNAPSAGTFACRRSITFGRYSVPDTPSGRGPKPLCRDSRSSELEGSHAPAPGRQCRLGSRRSMRCDRQSSGSRRGSLARSHTPANAHPTSGAISRKHTGLQGNDALCEGESQERVRYGIEHYWGKRRLALRRRLRPQPLDRVQDSVPRRCAGHVSVL